MPRITLVLVGMTLLVACADSPVGEAVAGPQFSHLIEECRGKDLLITNWQPLLPPDTNGNGKVCLKNEVLRIGREPTYYDDIIHIKQR